MSGQVARRPVMVGGTIIRYEGTLNEINQLGSLGIRASFYVVIGISYGILGIEVLSSIEVQIDVINKKLCIGGKELSSLKKFDIIQQSVQPVKFGREFASVYKTINSSKTRHA